MQARAKRRNEEAKVWFRSERVIMLAEDSWYVQTREGVDIGPYDTRFEAEIEGELLVELLKKATSEQKAMETLRDFIVDGYAMGHRLNPVYVEDLVAVAAN